MTHPFWEKHNPNYFALTFAIWGIGLGLALLYQILTKA
jgi:hypothetical protein